MCFVDVCSVCEDYINTDFIRLYRLGSKKNIFHIQFLTQSYSIFIIQYMCPLSSKLAISYQMSKTMISVDNEISVFKAINLINI